MRFCPECGNSIIQANTCNKCLKTFDVKEKSTLFPDIIKYRAEIKKLECYISEIQNNCDHEYMEVGRSPNYNEFGGYSGGSTRYKCLKCDKHTCKE